MGVLTSAALCRHCQTETSAMPSGMAGNCPSLRLSTPARLSVGHNGVMTSLPHALSFAWVCTAGTLADCPPCKAGRARTLAEVQRLGEWRKSDPWCTDTHGTPPPSCSKCCFCSRVHHATCTNSTFCSQRQSKLESIFGLL